MKLTPGLLDDLVGPARKQVNAIAALPERLHSAPPEGKQDILDEARNAAQKLMVAAEELHAVLRSATL